MNAERKRRVARMYDLFARPYEKWGARLQLLRPRLIHRMLDLQDEHRLLDVGTGPGVVPFALRRLGHEGPAVGIDISRGMIDRARRRAARASCNHLSFEVADAEELPFADASFDRATCVGVLLLIPDRARAISEVVRVLKYGGRGVIVEPAAAGPGKELLYWGFGALLRLLSARRPEFKGLEVSDYRGPSYLLQDEIAALIGEAGLRIRGITHSTGHVYCSFEKNSGNAKETQRDASVVGGLRKVRGRESGARSGCRER